MHALWSTTKMIQNVMELCAISPRMTVTVTKRGMNGNGLVKVKRGAGDEWEWVGEGKAGLLQGKT